MEKMIDMLFPEYMSVSEMTRILGISSASGYRLAHAGVFHVIRVGKAIRIERESFQNWVEKQSVQPVTDAV